MITVVSGYRRSGTSMMMQALYSGMKSGGIVFQKQMEDFNPNEVDGYIPTPGKLWEVGRGFYKNAEFLRCIPDDSLIKILFDGLPAIPKGEWTVIFMLRDEVEIRASYARSDAHIRAAGISENPKTKHTFDVYRPYNQEDLDHVIGICEARSDMDLFKIQYRDVIDDPVGIFTALQECGLDIDPEKSAAEVKPEYYRFRKENLLSKEKAE
jgi:hypothetical protein